MFVGTRTENPCLPRSSDLFVEWQWPVCVGHVRTGWQRDAGLQTFAPYRDGAARGRGILQTFAPYGGRSAGVLLSIVAPPRRSSLADAMGRKECDFE